MISTGYFIRRLLNKLVKITELTFCNISFLFRYICMYLKCLVFLRIVNCNKFYIWHFLLAVIFGSTLFSKLVSNFCQMIWIRGQKLLFPFSMVISSDKIIDWLGRYILFPFGFYHGKKPKRFVILHSNWKFSTQPLTFFWHNKTQKERVSTESKNYFIRPSLWLFYMDIWKEKQINQNYTSDICKYILTCVLVNTDQTLNWLEIFREV